MLNDTNYTLEKNVAMPARKYSTGRNPKYPFALMKVGHSFYAGEPRNRLAAAASQNGRRTGKKFSVRAEGKGARCWRVE